MYVHVMYINKQCPPEDMVVPSNSSDFISSDRLTSIHNLGQFRDTDSPLWQLILARPGSPWQQTHVPGGPRLLARVGALLHLEEGVEVALAAAVGELLALLSLRVVAVSV